MEAAYRKVDIGGVRISNIALEEVIDEFRLIIKEKKKVRVCVTPVNCVVWASNNPNLRNIYNSADFTLCDGVPLIWASRFLGEPLKGRVTGLDLLPKFIETCHTEAFSIFLLGAKDGVGEFLKQKLEKEFPGIKVVGIYSPPFAEKFSKEENEKMMQLINNVKPDVLWVSLTAPKQDYWIYENIDFLDVHIAIGVGGAFEVTAGLIDRAPKFMQKNGLEWLYRFVKEPRRLFKRYFVEAPMFIPIIIKQKFVVRKNKERNTRS